MIRRHLLGLQAGKPFTGQVQIDLLFDLAVRQVVEKLWFDVAHHSELVEEQDTVALDNILPGTYRILIAGGSNNWKLSAPNHSWAIMTPTHVSQYMGTLYFWVPDGVERFTIKLSSPAPAETAKLTVMNPQGEEVGQVSTTESSNRDLQVKVPPTMAGQAWSMHVGPANIGVVDDVGIQLGDNLPQLLSPSALQMLVPAEATDQ